MKRDERLLLYRKALELISSSDLIFVNELTGLCKTLGLSARILGFVKEHVPVDNGGHNPYYRINRYPELYRRRPDGQSELEFWWVEMLEYKSSGVEPRLRILKQAIKELEYRIRTERKP